MTRDKEELVRYHDEAAASLFAHLSAGEDVAVLSLATSHSIPLSVICSHV